MVRPSNRSARTSCYLFLIVILANQAALAHVTLDSPLGGENLNGGFLFPIEWHPAIEHDTIDWDLWYSTTGPSGPWLEIASDLPLGDPSQNAPHSFDWYVPNSALSQAWVRVRQDNTGQDYFDVSSASFSVTEALEADFTGNNIVDDKDFLVWEDGFGTSTDALFLRATAMQMATSTDSTFYSGSANTTQAVFPSARALSQNPQHFSYYYSAQ